MKRNNEKNLKWFIRNETGVTLVELLVSIALLSVIVTTFLSFFIQAARTNAMTDRVNEATFIAQEEMELLAYYSANKTLEETKNELKFEQAKNSNKIMRTSDKQDYEVITELTKNEHNLYTAIVKVEEGNKTHAQMENWLPFETE